MRRNSLICGKTKMFCRFGIHEVHGCGVSEGFRMGRVRKYGMELTGKY